MTPAQIERRLREEWWLNHGCPSEARYGDDGELQCNHFACMHDFRREPLEDLLQVVDFGRLRYWREKGEVSWW